MSAMDDGRNIAIVILIAIIAWMGLSMTPNLVNNFETKDGVSVADLVVESSRNHILAGNLVTAYDELHSEFTILHQNAEAECEIVGSYFGESAQDGCIDQIFQNGGNGYMPDEFGKVESIGMGDEAISTDLFTSRAIVSMKNYTGVADY